jgi:hypothetical protein
MSQTQTNPAPKLSNAILVRVLADDIRAATDRIRLAQATKSKSQRAQA